MLKIFTGEFILIHILKTALLVFFLTENLSFYRNAQNKDLTSTMSHNLLNPYPNLIQALSWHSVNILQETLQKQQRWSNNVPSISTIKRHCSIFPLWSTAEYVTLVFPISNWSPGWNVEDIFSTIPELSLATGNSHETDGLTNGLVRVWTSSGQISFGFSSSVIKKRMISSVNLSSSVIKTVYWFP